MTTADQESWSGPGNSKGSVDVEGSPAAEGPGDANAALARYQSQLDANQSEQDELAAKDRRFGATRVLLFFAAISFWLLWYFSDALPWAGWLGTIAMAVFFGVVVWNEPLRDRMDELHRQHVVLKRLIARLRRDWDYLATKQLTAQLATIELPPHQRDVADDLDLLGRASLFHLVSMAATMPGIRMLANWLVQTADADVARQRSEALEFLAPLDEKRLRFYTLAREVGESTGDPDHFVQWAGQRPWLDSHRWLSQWATLSAILAIALLALLAGGLVNVLPESTVRIAVYGVISLVVINLLLTGTVLGPVHQIFSIAMSNRQAVRHYQELFSAARWLESGIDNNDENSGGCLDQIRRQILEGERCATSGMNALQRVATAGSLRQSAATFLLYLPLQMFGLWDVHVFRRLEDWKRTFGPDVAGWFDALGQLEALMSLAALRDEYPGWARANWVTGIDAFPEQAVVKATSIGHPLLPDEVRVCNDVEVGPPGTFLLVTGSNMSGKSTMLRSIGLNVSLAAAGAPVCASAFRLPSIELGTSIRVVDNVSEGVSFYMAELQRLKSVVDQARRLETVKGTMLLFLLDEILQGTNSRERQIAVVQVLRHLIRSGAIGAISTHDLELADEPELQSLSVPVHFRETIHPDATGKDQMTFDYRMRHGVAPTTNALRLLEIVGLGNDKRA